MKCSVDWCDGKSFARGVCRAHTNHLYRYGETRRFSHTPNKIIIKKKHAEIVLYNRDMSPSGKVALISIEDATNPEITSQRFYFSHGYTKVSHYSPTVYLHQIISRCEYPLVCDHINQNKLDCRIENLRCVTRKQNIENMTISLAEYRWGDRRKNATIK